MSAKKFNTPFAILGDKAEVPTTAQIDGSVSFEQGYPFGYELDYTDPNTKDISRSKTNQLLFDITNAIREIQQGGVSEWSEEGKLYKINSLVYAPDGTVKQSLIANNNNDTTHSSWSNLVNASNTLFVKLSGDQTIGGIKTFSESPIVPTPTTGDNSTKVATTAFVKAKSEADSIGVNQTWQDVTSSRSLGVIYTNNTGKPIVLSASTTEGVSGSSMGIVIDGVTVANQNIVNAAFKFSSIAIIPNNSIYRVDGYGVVIQNWSELR